MVVVTVVIKAVLMVIINRRFSTAKFKQLIFLIIQSIFTAKEFIIISFSKLIIFIY